MKDSSACAAAMAFGRLPTIVAILPMLALLTPFNIGMITSDDWGELCQRGTEGETPDR